LLGPHLDSLKRGEASDRRALRFELSVPTDQPSALGLSFPFAEPPEPSCHPRLMTLSTGLVSHPV